jgi:hypothetical protein
VLPVSTLLSGPRPISCTLRVHAAPSAVFDLLGDPRRHVEIDGSGTLQGCLVGPERLGLGSRFGMSMRYWGLPYRITSTVTEYEQNRQIAWMHLGRVVWRYELREVPGGTEITETWDPASSPLRIAYRWLGFPRRTLPALLGTLERIRVLVETPLEA